MTKSSLAVKYRPAIFDDLVGQDTVKQILLEEINTNTVKRVYLFTGPAGCGKAQPLYSKVLTPNGYITMGDVEIGTEVFTDKGNVAKVSEIYPQGERDIYEITLQDGAKIRVADNHLNCVYHYNQDRKMREDFVIPTTELITKFKNQRYKLRVDLPKVDFEPQPVLIDPYLLGCLLGDGGLNGKAISFSNAEEDVLDKVQSVLKLDYGMYLKRRCLNKHDYVIQYIENPKHGGSRGDKGQHPLKLNYDPLTTLRGQLDYYGLRCSSLEKHIPREYLLNSEDVRLQLLQGLYDTDGEKKGRGYSTSSARLAEDMVFLLRSLGVRVTVKSRKPSYNDGKCATSYRLYIKAPKGFPLFTSKKHKQTYVPPQHAPLRNIESIEYIGREECQCIMVDHTDHTYISDDFIPTHNTSSGRLFANALESYKSNIIEINAADRTGVDDVREIINQSKSKPLQGLRKIFIIDEVHALSQNAFSALLKLLEEPPAHCIFILCTTDPQKIIGTIMSRVYRYDFQKIAMNVIVDRLNDILEREKSDVEGCGVQTWDKVALEHIAKSSNGGMRTAITTLDKCISYNKNVTLENVISVLGTTSYDLMFKLLDALLQKNELELMNTINEISQKSADLKLFVKHFLELVLDVHRYIVFKNFDYVSIPTAYMGKLNTYHNGNCQYLKYLIAKLIQLNSDLKWESNPKLLIEGSLLLEVM